MSDLDSFFAKKDKKKNKAKKFTTDEIAKRLEHTERKVERINYSSPRPELIQRPQEAVDPTISTTEPTANPAEQTTVELPHEPIKEPKIEEEEEWNDIVEKTVDVSNLRITQLNMEEEEEGWGGSGEGGEEGKDNNGEEKKDGVWKIEEQKSIQTTICEAVDAGLDDGLQKVKATVAALSADARWNTQLSKEIQPSLLPRGIYQPGARRKKAAPDITNDMAFPSLADAQAAGGRKKRDEHEGEQRPRPGMGGSLRGVGSSRDGGSGNSSSGAYKPPMLRTNNRFGALTDHSSLMRQS